MGYHLTTSPENAWPAKFYASPKTHVPGSPVKERGYRYYVSETGAWASRDPLGEAGGLKLYSFSLNDPIGHFDALGLLGDSATTSFWTAMASGNYELAATVLEALQGVLTKETLASLAVALAAAVAAEGLIGHLNDHIQKVIDACPGLSPDPNNPDNDPVKGWLKEIKAAIENLKKQLKNTPKNKSKQKPLEDAIKKGEEFLKQVEEAGKKPCPSCVAK